MNHYRHHPQLALPINPHHFCATKNRRYEFLKAPAIYLGKTLASDGIAMLLSPIDNKYPILQPPENYAVSFKKNTYSYFEEIEATQLAPAPKITLPATDDCRVCSTTGKALCSPCPECDGDSKIEFETAHNSYSCDCKSCYGNGQIGTQIGGDHDCTHCHGTGQAYPKYHRVEINGIKIAAHYLALIAGAPDLQTTASEDKKKLIFKTGDQSGMIMAMKH
ncbi:MAG: hypothetical protein KUG64_10930 [Cycloclasticus sp.]|nr:hypothetical protein [Cycloclasticus sp.]